MKKFNMRLFVMFAVFVSATLSFGQTMIDITASDDSAILKTTLGSAAEGDTILLKRGMAYDLSATALSKSVIIMSAEGPGGPAILEMSNSSLDVVSGSAIAVLKFMDVEIQGDISGGYLMNFSTDGSIGDFILDNVSIHNLRGIFRAKNDGVKTIDNFTITNSLIDSIAGYGVMVMDNANAACANVNLTNSTFKNVDRVLRWRSTVDANAVVISQSTFYNTPMDGDFVRLDNAITNGVEISNTIFGLSNNKLVNGTATVNATNSYKTSDCALDGFAVAPTDYAGASTDLFTDPVNGDFSFKDVAFEGRFTAGDPENMLVFSLVEEGVYYNIVQKISGNVLGEGTPVTQPAVMTQENSGAQAFQFIAIDGKDDTYYIQNKAGLYFNKDGKDNWTTVYAADMNGALSEWVVKGSDMSSVTMQINDNLINIGEAKSYLAADGTASGSNVYCDKPNQAVGSKGEFMLQTAVIIPETVLAHSYTFEDGTANDVVGDLNGTVNGASISIADGYATVSGADAPTSGYISLDAAALALNTYYAITLEAYVKTFDGANSGYTMLCYFGNNVGGNKCLWYQPARSGNESRAETNNGSVTKTAGLGGVELDDGKLHHVVVILTGETLQYWLDGSLVSETATEGDYITTLDNQVANIFKGPDAWGDANYNVNLDEFNIYNGAISVDSISMHADNYLAATDASLSDITVSAGELSPVFSSPVKNYGLLIPEGATTVNLMGTPKYAATTVTGGGDIDVTSGSATVVLASTSEDGTGVDTTTIYVKVDDGCFTPLYSELDNLVADPELTNISLWGGWGSRNIYYGPEAYCGASSALLESPDRGCKAALDVAGVTWQPSTTYRLHVMVKTIDGSIGFLATNTDPNILFSVDTEGEWELVDTTFTTGANAGGGIFTFNTCDAGSNCTAAYIDNYELYKFPKMVAYVTAQKDMDATASMVAEDPIINMLEADKNIELTVMVVAADSVLGDISMYDAVIVQEGFGSGSAILKPEMSLGLEEIPVPFIYNKMYGLRSGKALTSGVGASKESSNLSYMVDVANQGNDLFKGITFEADTFMVFRNTYNDAGAAGNKSLNYNIGNVVSVDNTLLGTPKGATDVVFGINDVPAGTVIDSDTLQARMIAVGMNFGAISGDMGYNLTNEGLTLWRNAVYSLVGLEIPAEVAYAPKRVVAFVSKTPLDKDSVVVNAILAKGIYDVMLINAGSKGIITADNLAELNAADVVIMGRNIGSSDVGTAQVVWDDVTAPVLSMNMWGLRGLSGKAWWTTNAVAANVTANPDTVLTANILLADDAVFAGLTSTSIDWWTGMFSVFGPDENDDNAGNGLMLAKTTDNSPLFMRWAANREFYRGAGHSPKGDRTYIGNGNDDTELNYFGFSAASEVVFFNELARMASGVAAVIPLKADFIQSDEGMVDIPAEDFSSNTAGTGSKVGDAWVLGAETVGFMGTGYMQSVMAAGDGSTGNAETVNAKLSYMVDFVKTGTHYIWTHVNFPSDKGDSFFYGLSGKVSDKVDGSPYGEWKWDSGNTTFEVAEIGIQSLDIMQREPGALVDQIVVTTDPNYDPNNTDAINDIELASGLTLYPNPTRDFAQLRIEMTNPALANLSIYNMVGQMTELTVSQQLNAGVNVISIDTQSLKRGMYIFVLKAGGQSYQGKINIVK